MGVMSIWLGELSSGNCRCMSLCRSSWPKPSSCRNSPEAAIRNQLAEYVDIPGFNYQPWLYAGTLKEHPGWIVYGSETSSCVSSRGVYQLPIEKYQKHPSLQLTSYDVISPPWAYCPDAEFLYQERMPQVLGEFVWTGWDYLGEPTPFDSARSSYSGIIDLAGFKKDRFYLYQAHWRPDFPMAHILPHWTWPERTNQVTPVHVYTSGDEAELFLNPK